MDTFAIAIGIVAVAAWLGVVMLVLEVRRLRAAQSEDGMRSRVAMRRADTWEGVMDDRTAELDALRDRVDAMEHELVCATCDADTTGAGGWHVAADAQEATP